jgi:hypothetical protein
MFSLAFWAATAPPPPVEAAERDDKAETACVSRVGAEEDGLKELEQLGPQEPGQGVVLANPQTHLWIYHLSEVEKTRWTTPSSKSAASTEAAACGGLIGGW